MMLSRDMAPKPLDRCHGGEGTIFCKERLADYARTHGIRFVHEDRIPPGTSIGLHAHTKDEELYIILSGSGEMSVDDVRRPVGPGDICLTREGHRHALYNTGKEDMHLYVIGCAGKTAP